MHFLALPNELLQDICEYSLESLPELSQTCSKLRSALSYSELWRKHNYKMYKEMGLWPSEIDSIPDFHLDYWKQLEINREVQNLLNLVVTGAPFPRQYTTKICEYGPRARLILHRKRDLLNQEFIPSGPDNSIAHVYHAEDLLTVIRRRRALEQLCAVAKDPACYDALDLFQVINAGFPENPEDPTTTDSMYLEILKNVNGECTRDFVTGNSSRLLDNDRNKQIAVDLLNEVTRVHKATELKRSGFSTSVDRRQYRSLVYVCTYCTILRAYGFKAKPMLYKSGLKWRGFVQLFSSSLSSSQPVLQKEEEDSFFVMVSDSPKIYTKPELDQFAHERKVTWSSLEEIACRFISTTSRVTSEQQASQVMSKAIRAIFATSGRFLEWTNSSSLELKNPLNSVSIDGEMLVAGQVSDHLLLKRMNGETTYTTSTHIGKVVRDQRQTSRYGVVVSGDDSVFHILRDDQSVTTIPEGYFEILKPKAYEIRSWYRQHIKHLGRHFCGYDETIGEFIPRQTVVA